MKITFNTEEFKNAVNKAFTVINPKTVLPIAENFYFQVEQSFVTINASNTQDFLRIKCECDSDEVGDLIMDASRLFNTINKFKSDIITFAKDGNRLKIQSGRSQVTLPLVDDKYLFIPPTDCEFTQYESSVLLSGISNVKEFIDNDEFRPVMNSIHMKQLEDRIVFGTAHKNSVLSQYNIETCGSEFDECIPKNSVRSFMSVLEDSDYVSLGFTDKHIVLKDSEHTLMATKVNGTFPSFDNIIPQDYNDVVTFDKKEMQHALKIVDGYTGVTRATIIEITADKLILKAENKEFGVEALTEIDCSSTASKTMKFDRSYFSRLVSNHPSEEVPIHFKEDSKACLFKSDGYVGMLMLIANV